MKEKKKNFDSILIFESPLIIKGKKVYGFVYEMTSDFCINIQVEYLTGIAKWINIGNLITSQGQWCDNKNNMLYGGESEFVKDFCKQAYEENHIGYTFQENLQFGYAEEDIIDNLIVSEKFWDWAIGQMEELADFLYSRDCEDCNYLECF